MTWLPMKAEVVPIGFAESTPAALEATAECTFYGKNIHFAHVILRIVPRSSTRGTPHT